MPELKLEKRTDTGKKFAKKLRREGKIPGVYYTHGKDSIPVTVNEKELRAIVSSEVNIIDLNLDNKKYKSVVREVQYDPILGMPLHVDFMGIRLDEKIHITVPIHLIGTPAGVKEGGILQLLLREIDVAALPLEIPEHIDVDVSELNIGDSIHVSEISVEKVEILTDVERSIATVSAPTVVKEPVVEELEEELVEGEEEEEAEEEPSKEPDTE